MKASELRIGNYYMFADYNGIVYRQVQEIKHNQFGLLSDYDIVNFEICRPIPLTEEWVLKLGFEYHSFDKNYVIKNKDGYCNSIKNNDGEWCYNNDISDANCYFIRELKYVHQLQNLYYALNEEELTIK
jgi:hypothetical protein